MAEAEIGIFGGSGFYAFLEEVEEVELDTPHGKPSAPFVIGELDGKRVAFLPRHGRKHELPPHAIPYRANVWAMKELGVRRIIDPNASGALKAELRLGEFVVCDQFVDRTSGRKDTFYDGPETTHVSAADPYCPDLRTLLVETAQELDIPVRDGGTVVTIQGPRFSTRAEAKLIAAFHANVNSLIHLYVIGVFTAFTLAQAGMVRFWRRGREPGWGWRAAMNGLGAATTGVVAVIVIWTKFVEGAWMVMIAIPVLIISFYAVHRHYRTIGRRLTAKAQAVLARPEPRNTVVLYVERLDAATREAFWYARQISNGSLRAIHVPTASTDPGIRPRFFNWSQGSPHLEVLPSDEGPVETVLEYIWSFPAGEGDFVTVVIPELFRTPSLVSAVMHRTTFSLKLDLLKEPGVVVTNVPKIADPRDRDWMEPSRAVCVVPVSTLNAASLRALLYARSLGFRDTTAVFFSLEEDDAAHIEREWQRFPTRVPLDVVDAPYRDLGKPLLTYLRRITADPDAVAIVVMPELIVRGTDRLLHNQRALYLKRLLLFEPRVILASVPYQLV